MMRTYSGLRLIFHILAYLTYIIDKTKLTEPISTVNCLQRGETL